MNSISGTSSGSPYRSLTSQIASGTRLQRAADGPSEMAIAEKENAQIGGLKMGERNARDGKSLLNVADGAMSGIADNLHRMRELAIQASNTAVLSEGDRRLIQDEIDQLKEGISDIAKNTEFNKKKLLDGNGQDGHIASSPDGSGPDLEIGAATLQALGIQDFDVTGNFSVQTIDDALSKVSSNQSKIGAQSNGLDYNIAYNSNAAIQMTSAVSRLEDTDIAEAASELNKQKLLQSYQIMVQKKQQEEEAKKLSLFYI